LLTTLNGRPNARRSECAQQIDVAGELIGLQPDVLLATSTPVTSALAQETQTIPIVFALVNDPIAHASSRACPILAATLLGSPFLRRQ